MEKTKLCSKCGQFKSLNEFYKSTRGGCKVCVRNYQRTWYQRNRAKSGPELPRGLRKCSKCNQIKSVDQFYRDRANASGYHHHCKACSNELRSNRRRKVAAEKVAKEEPIPEGHKRCSRCERILLYQDFYRLRKSSDGRKSQCKTCEKAYQKTEKAKARASAYQSRPDIRVRINAKRRARRQTDLEFRAKEKTYRQKYQKRDYVVAKNKQHQAEYRSRPENKRRARQSTIEWRQENPERCREQARIKYLRKKGADGEHASDQWETLLALCSHRCLVCATTENLTRDHIIPLAWGGSDKIDNIQPLCHQHNAEKHQSYAADYRPAYIRAWAHFQSYPALEAAQ